MARIRSIKPDAFHSDTLSQVPRGVRWTFAGLWTYCDDEGRGRHDIRLIKAALYPLDDTVTLDILATDLDDLERVGCICTYDIGGRRFLHVPGWEHQKINRPTPSKLPECPTPLTEHSVSPHGMGSEQSLGRSDGVSPYSLNPHGALTEDSLAERKGKEQGTGKGNARARVSDLDNDPAFAAFWAAYPRRTDKGHAKTAWLKVLKGEVDTAVVVAAAERFAARSRSDDPKFIPHPSTWLNGERWTDEPQRLGTAANPDELPPVEQSWMRRRPQ